MLSLGFPPPQIHHNLWLPTMNPDVIQKNKQKTYETPQITVNSEFRSKGFGIYFRDVFLLTTEQCKNKLPVVKKCAKSSQELRRNFALRESVF